jgi:lipoteichoic acid synthase
LAIIKNDLQQLAKLNRQEIRRSCLDQERYTNQPHIVFIQLESVPGWAVDQATSIMPFLKKLKQENLSVDHFFANSCETINAEYSTLCGFSVDSTGPIPNKYSESNYYCLPQILRDKLKYQTNLYHANYPDFWSRDKLAPRWGFDNLHVSPEFEIRTSDLKVLDQLATDLKTATQPTFNYFISFTSHSPHSETYLKKYNENNLDYADVPFFALNDVPIKIKNSIELTDSTTNYYLSLLKAVDQSLEHFFKKLDEYGLRENTIVFIYGDHRYYNFKPANTLENFYNYNEIPLVMVLPDETGQGGASVASHLDVAPTLLDLLNRRDLIPENFIGQSLFDNNFHNLAINKCLQEFSYIDQNVVIRGNSVNQKYYLFSHLNKDASGDAYLKIIPELNQMIDVYLPEMLGGEKE